MASGPRRGNSSGSVGAGGAYDQSHVCRYRGLRGKGVGRRPSAVGQKCGNTWNPVVGLDSLVAVQCRGMAGAGGTSRVSGSQRLESMTSADNSRPSDLSRSRIRGMETEIRSRKSHRERYGPAVRAQGPYRPAGACPRVCF